MLVFLCFLLLLQNTSTLNSGCNNELPHMCDHLEALGEDNEYCEVYENRWSKYCKKTCSKFCLPTTTKTTVKPNTDTTITTKSTKAVTTTTQQPFTTQTTTVFTIPPNTPCGDLLPFCLNIKNCTSNSNEEYTKQTCWKSCGLCYGPDAEECLNYKDLPGYECENENCLSFKQLDRFRVYQRCSRTCCNKGQFTLSM